MFLNRLRIDASGMRRRNLLLAGGAALLGAAPPSAHAVSDPEPTDRMPDFWRAYDATRGMAMPDRARRLADGFFADERALYRRAGMRPLDADAIASWLAVFDPMADSVRAVHARFASGYQSNLKRFRSVFDDFDATASPVFVLPSLFRFDAHLESDGATLPLFFGPDGIARYHDADADLDVLFAHEIFHCYQAQRNPSLCLDPSPPIFGGLWIEGVATWVSEKLNPNASPRHVLLDDDKLLRDGPSSARRVAATLLDRIDSRENADHVAFFTSGFKGDWPARAGYYVGLLAARRIGRTMSMQAMAALPTPQVRERLVAELKLIRDGATS